MIIFYSIIITDWLFVNIIIWLYAKIFVLQQSKVVVQMYYYQRLRDLREDRDLKQSDISEYLGMKQPQYNRYETGMRELPLHHLVALCRFYNVSADYILGFTDEPRKLNK